MDLKINLPYPLVAFDTETGGLNPDHEITWNLEQVERGNVGEVVSGKIQKLPAPILEVGAILISPKDLSEIDSFHSLCGPEKDEPFERFLNRCSRTALEINGFKGRLEELKAAPPLSVALKNFKEWLPKQGGNKVGKFLPTGQNVRFDIEMINAACKHYGVDLQIRTPPIELMSYSQLYFALPDTEIVANYKLTTVSQALGISTKDAHTALADVRMTLACLRKMFSRFSRS